MRYAVLLMLAGLAAGPSFGSDCFCLQDENDQLWFDCREQQRPSGIHVFCADSKTQEPAELTGRMDDLNRIPGGEHHCTPCRLDEVPSNGPDKPRGDGNKKVP
ncbi:MAG: hypothetical protein LGR52_08015 [Candidatus Thiosymbion ectosymbiont of Robbea hypermnestra]|nr:hypothetical protein [Candidatus Thiosymbion ectosymbiont of Robbea hypermnestra]